MLGTKEPGRSVPAPGLEVLVRESELERALVRGPDPVARLELAKQERALVRELELALVPELQRSLFLNFRRRHKQTT